VIGCIGPHAATTNVSDQGDISGTFTVVVRRLSVNAMEENMGLGRGALLWLLGVPLPIIILLALFWHH
jgi:hypothetical protein